MTAEEDRALPDEHAGRLLAIVQLLAEMALQALKQGEVDGARGFVDSIESLQVKTKGNLGELEENAFEGILYQLRIAVVQGRPPSAEEDSAGEAGGGEPGEEGGEGRGDDEGGDSSVETPREE